MEFLILTGAIIRVKSWIRDAEPGQEGPYSPIKTVYYQNQQGGSFVEQNAWAPIFTVNSINFIRLADVLLWAAEVEVEIESGSTDLALDYVNQVRARAMNRAGWVHTDIDPANPMLGFTDIPAANYKISDLSFGFFF